MHEPPAATADTAVLPRRDGATPRRGRAIDSGERDRTFRRGAAEAYGGCGDPPYGIALGTFSAVVTMGYYGEVGSSLYAF